MDSLERVASELAAIDIAPRVVVDPAFYTQRAVAFEYTVEVGRYRGRVFDVAISFQEEGYPEYPPHFIHVKGLSDANVPEHTSFRFEDARWASFSVPPSDFWDSLPSSEKNMKTYIQRHLVRFLDQV